MNYEMLRGIGPVDAADLQQAINELGQPDIQDEDRSGYWQTVVQAMYNVGPNDDAVRNILKGAGNQQLFAELKDELGPADLPLPFQGGRRRRRKAKKTRKVKKARRATRRRA